MLQLLLSEKPFLSESWGCQLNHELSHSFKPLDEFVLLRERSFEPSKHLIGILLDFLTSLLEHFLELLELLPLLAVLEIDRIFHLLLELG